jgi:hypothetical protein
VHTGILTLSAPGEPSAEAFREASGNLETVRIMADCATGYYRMMIEEACRALVTKGTPEAAPVLRELGISKMLSANKFGNVQSACLDALLGLYRDSPTQLHSDVYTRVFETLQSSGCRAVIHDMAILRYFVPKANAAEKGALSAVLAVLDHMNADATGLLEADITDDTNHEVLASALYLCASGGADGRLDEFELISKYIPERQIMMIFRICFKRLDAEACRRVAGFIDFTTDATDAKFHRLVQQLNDDTVGPPEMRRAFLADLDHKVYSGGMLRMLAESGVTKDYPKNLRVLVDVLPEDEASRCNYKELVKLEIKTAIEAASPAEKEKGWPNITQFIAELDAGSSEGSVL